MPSFDIVSEINQHELTNAIDQTNREISNRFDFKDSNAKVVLTKSQITITAPTEFQLKQVDEIMRNKLTKRNIDIRVLTYKDIDKNLSEARQLIDVKDGIDQENAKKIVKLIKDAQFKVQAAIQGNQIRVTGKKKDDLQDVIAHLRQAKTDVPLQFNNFRE